MTHLQRTNSLNSELLQIIANHKNTPLLKFIPITIMKKNKSCFCFCQSSSDEHVSCPICIESIPNQNIFITSCNHTFCVSCIIEYIKYQKKIPSFKQLSCPLCRQEITEFKINHKKHIRLLQFATLSSFVK
jgi:hypothetical protein